MLSILCYRLNLELFGRCRVTNVSEQLGHIARDLHGRGFEKGGCVR